ncbi:MAG: TlpA family protein disulfide reductase [Alphaproteobacteria bacterium]|nr:TlpA family protein disulfide reductase [Alphaproteobacteria bacterium]
MRRAAQVVATRVAEDELFEKPGERVPPDPLPARAERVEAASGSEGEASDEDEEPAAPSGAVSGLPEQGCRKADLALLRVAHGPGPRPRIVNHWATWCLPCVDELPHLTALRRELGGSVDFLGVSWDLFDPRGDEDDVVEHVANFAAGNGIDWPSLLVTVPSDEFFPGMGIGFEKIPQTWVIGRDGAVLRKVEGVVDADVCAELAALVRGS